MSIISDKDHKPEMEEISDFIGNPLFDRLLSYMQKEFKALISIDYSGDNVLLGWNVSFRKSGRSLCRLYPKAGYFSVLIVIGRREKERVEAMLPQMSEAMREIYLNTQEGMGQRWLLMDLKKDDMLYDDLLKLIAIRRENR